MEEKFYRRFQSYKDSLAALSEARTRDLSVSILQRLSIPCNEPIKYMWITYGDL